MLQNDIANEHSPITIVAAITSKFDEKLYPTEVPIPQGEGGLEQVSVALLNQIRSVDKRRLIKKLGILRNETMRDIETALKISIGLTEL